MSMTLFAVQSCNLIGNGCRSRGVWRKCNIPPGPHRCLKLTWGRTSGRAGRLHTTKGVRIPLPSHRRFNSSTLFTFCLPFSRAVLDFELSSVMWELLRYSRTFVPTYPPIHPAHESRHTGITTVFSYRFHLAHSASSHTLAHDKPS